MRGRIDLLSGAGFAARGVAVELRLPTGAVEHHPLYHLAHLGRGERGEHAMRAWGQGIGQLASRLEWRRQQRRQLRRGGLLAIGVYLARHEHVRRQIDSAVGDGGDHRDQLQRRYRNLLPDGDGPDRRRTPLAYRPQQATRLAGPLRAGARAETEVADERIEVVRPQLESQLDGGRLA